MSSAKRARTQNYNLEDTLTLANAAKAYKNILENKKIDAVTARDKQRAWETISCLYNTHKQPQMRFSTFKIVYVLYLNLKEFVSIFV